MKIVKGCLLEAFSKGHVTTIAHQVNCQRKMASGVAGSIAEAYPEHKEDYLKSYQGLGDYVLTVVPEGFIYGIFGQEYYGRTKRYTNYSALISGLSKVMDVVSESSSSKTLGIPYGVGCGLGGGNWKLVQVLLNDLSEIYPEVELVVYKKENT